MSLSSTSPAFGISRLILIAAMLIAALLAGCGEQKKPATQVAAKVGTDEITIGQVNSVLSKMKAVPGKTAAQVKHEVLDNLIDQQLAMRQAIDKKLDRDPAVMQAIEEAKSAILTRAYMDRIRAGIPNPSTEEIGKYYADHPELFAQRRIFNMRELDIAGQPGLANSLRDQIAKGATLEAIAAGLKSKNIQFSGNVSTHTPEETPFEILSRISVLKDGQMTLIEGKNALTILQVVASKSAPVDEKTASTAIQQYLSNNRSSEEISKELKSLRKSTKIEYFGEFLASADTDTAHSTAEVSDGTEAPGKMPGKMTEQPHTSDVAKAVAGLK